MVSNLTSCIYVRESNIIKIADWLYLLHVMQKASTILYPATYRLTYSYKRRLELRRTGRASFAIEKWLLAYATSKKQGITTGLLTSLTLKWQLWTFSLAAFFHLRPLLGAPLPFRHFIYFVLFRSLFFVFSKLSALAFLSFIFSLHCSAAFRYGLAPRSPP